MEKDILEELQDAKLHRQLSSLILAHLRDSNLYQPASAVASATMTSLNAEAPCNRLLELVSKGLAVEKDEILRGETKGSLKSFPKHETRHLSEHKCARFSPDRKFVSKIKQMMLVEARDGPMEPVICTFDDHLQVISKLHITCGFTWILCMFHLNDLDFHPQNTVLISGSKDQTIKFFDFYKMTAKRAFRDTHKVRSLCFHPSGDILLAGTEHPIPHLYDVNTFQCYLSVNAPDIDVNGAVNLVRYSATGGKYVVASKDSVIRLWDGITAKCAHSIPAHGTAEATSANFTKDQRFVLSSGKDSTVKLWEVDTGKLVKQYLGATQATHTQLRCQAVSNDTEEFVLSIDEPTNEIVIWDATTANKVAKWPSNHIGAFRWLAHLPTEAAFVTCGTDRSIRFWKESLSSL
ncbi:unnamed protein product [Malus baccata var. baccata]